jgi:hypothetical protein
VRRRIGGSGIEARTGGAGTWELKDPRKTCATYYDQHVPESSIEILGHSVSGITYRHYAHRAGGLKTQSQLESGFSL